MTRLRKLIALAATLLPVASWAAPPPPPPPYLIERGNSIVTPPSEDGESAYGNLFAKNVKVFDGGKLVASGRAAWLKYLKPRLALHVKRLKVSYGNPIISVETINNISFRPGVVQDCCFWARVATYHLRADGKVDEIRFTENGTYWGPPDNPE